MPTTRLLNTRGMMVMRMPFTNSVPRGSIHGTSARPAALPLASMMVPRARPPTRARRRRRVGDTPRSYGRGRRCAPACAGETTPISSSARLQSVPPSPGPSTTSSPLRAPGPDSSRWTNSAAMSPRETRVRSDRGWSPVDSTTGRRPGGESVSIPARTITYGNPLAAIASSAFRRHTSVLPLTRFSTHPMNDGRFTPSAVMYSTWPRNPSPCAAASAARTPSYSTALMTRSPAGRRVTPAVNTNASIPEAAPRSVSGCVRSPTTTSIPDGSPARLAASRTTARTRCPRATSRFASSAPVPRVPPQQDATHHLDTLLAQVDRAEHPARSALLSGETRLIASATEVIMFCELASSEISLDQDTLLHLPFCPIERTIRVLDTKWTALLMRDLLGGTRRFSELRRSLEGISPKTLTGRLRALEEQGIVHRTIHAEVPPRVEYTLTEYGQSLRPVLEAMAAWGIRDAEREAERSTDPEKPRDNATLPLTADRATR